MDVQDGYPLVLSEMRARPGGAPEEENETMEAAIALVQRLTALIQEPRQWRMERPAPDSWKGETWVNGLRVEVGLEPCGNPVEGGPDIPQFAFRVLGEDRWSDVFAAFYVDTADVMTKDLEVWLFKRGPWEAQLMAQGQ